MSHTTKTGLQSAERVNRGNEALGTLRLTVANPKAELPINRYPDRSVQRAKSVPESGRLQVYVLTPDCGFINADRPIPPDAESFKLKKTYKRKVDFVACQLRYYGISRLKFLIAPFDTRRLNCLRLMVLACDRAEVRLELVNEDGEPFPDWSPIVEEAKAAERSVSEGRESVEEAFRPLTEKYENDGWVLFSRGEAYTSNKDFEHAAADFFAAQVLFPIRSWKEKAKEKAVHVLSQLGDLHRRTHRLPMKCERDRISNLSLPDFITDNDNVSTILDLIDSCPLLTIDGARSLTIRIIMERDPNRNRNYEEKGAFWKAIDELGVRSEIKEAMRLILNRRNETEYRTGSPSPNVARVCAEALVKVLTGVYSPRSR
jgi:hypothetical protein